MDRRTLRRGGILARDRRAPPFSGPWCGPSRQDHPIGRVRACIGPLSTFRYCLFTEEALDFIINYDIKYRMGRDAEVRHELRFSTHARQEIARRRISRDIVEGVLAAPAQKVSGHAGILCYQSVVEIDRKPYLVRVMVNETASPPTVVTAYRTKYWRTT